MSYCKFCGMEIEWIRTPKGTFVPVDPDPVLVIENEGNDEFLDEETGEFTGRTAYEWENGSRVGWVPHIRACQYMKKEKGR